MKTGFSGERVKFRNTDIYQDLNFTYHLHFQSLQAASRCRDTQLQVTENLNLNKPVLYGLKNSFDKHPQTLTLPVWAKPTRCFSHLLIFYQHHVRRFS